MAMAPRRASGVKKMPAANLPARVAASATRFIASSKHPAGRWPSIRIPWLWAMSSGPKKRASTPSTAAMASAFPSASTLSIWQTTSGWGWSACE